MQVVSSKNNMTSYIYLCCIANEIFFFFAILSGPKLHSSQQNLPIYTADTLAIAVATSCVAALVVGFISGFLFSRRCRGEDYSSGFPEMPFPEQRRQLNRSVK